MGIEPKGLVEAQLREANIGPDYWEVDLKNFKGPDKAKWRTFEYLQNLDRYKNQGVGILYNGPNGPGKTTLAMIVMKYLIRARWSVYTTSLGELVECIQRSWKTEDDDSNYTERARQSDFLLIDDVGKEHRGQTGFVSTIFDNLIRSRVQNRLPTFLTTNYTKGELENTYGQSAMSLLEGKLIPITVDGRDYRREVLKKEIRSV